MASFFNRMRQGTGTSNPSGGSALSKKDPNAANLTPLERHLLDVGPLKEDGSDKFWGLENFGNTCYANSILQCLYYSVPFREQVIQYPAHTPNELVINTSTGQERLHTNTISLPLNHPSLTYTKLMNRQANQAAGPRSPPGGGVTTYKPEDKEHPDYKKRVAHARGPTIAMSYDNASAYQMQESLFTSLKDIFEAIYVHKSRTGVVSPSRFLEILKRDNEMFRTAMHQDAHEFLNLLLNDVVENVEIHSRKKLEDSKENNVQELEIVKTASPVLNSTGWVHELFEGTLTSETKCLTCENASQRDEAFLDLSVDLDEHTSVTSCLRKFSEEEMLCERNKFHCDNCGGLQEAEKRMKIKRLPKILALHLKRFKYTEDLQRLQKLFHRVVYPYHLRLFNTTDDADDPDRLYELYAVVVHIGGGPYHGHYVSIIKTESQGWLLFDDEMVEPVDKSYVQNFFGDRPGLACAYVLFYQETTLEAVKREQDAESQMEPDQVATEAAAKDNVHGSVKSNGILNGIHQVRNAAIPAATDESRDALEKTASEPALASAQVNGDVTALPQMTSIAPADEPLKSKKESKKEDKERRAAAKLQAREDEKAEREKRRTLELKRKEILKKQEAETKAAIAASKQSKADEDRKTTGENGPSVAVQESSGLNRFKNTSKSFKRPKFLGSSSRDASREETMPDGMDGAPDKKAEKAPPAADKSPEKGKISFSALKKKTSHMIL